MIKSMTGFASLTHEDERATIVLRELLELGIRETVHVSELLQIPTLVGTHLVGIFPASMGPVMEQRLGLQVLPLPARIAFTADIHDLA